MAGFRVALFQIYFDNNFLPTIIIILKFHLNLHYFENLKVVSLITNSITYAYPHV